MTLYEICNKYRLQIKKIRAQQVHEVNVRLRELRLDGLVKRKIDGKVGKLVYNAIDGFKFHPLLKSGKISYSYTFTDDVEKNFEPAEEVEV